MNKQGLAANTVIGTIGSVTTRLLGMWAMIFISNKIGAEGVGLYQLTMTIYSMAFMIASAGISTSVSKLVAEEIGRGWGYRAKKVMNTFFVISIIMSTVIAGSVFIYAEPISLRVISDARTMMGLKILALSIPFMTLSSCFKGYFYAVKKVYKPASSDVIEQIIKLVLIIELLQRVGDQGLAYGCAAIGVGMTLGEILSFTYMFLLYTFDKDRRVNKVKRASHTSEQSPILPKIVKVLLPITLTAYLGAVFMLLENVLIPVGFRKAGLASGDSMAMYGMIKGMVFPILFFPTALLSACSTVLTPEIARAQSLRYKERVEVTSGRMIHFTMILAMIVVCIFCNYGKELGILIYNNEQVGTLLAILVIITPFMYMEIVVDGILKGLGEQNSCLKYRIIDSILRVALIYWVIPIKGVEAFIAITIGSNILTSILNLNRLVHVIDIKLQFTKWIFYPALSAIAAGMISKVCILYLIPKTLGLWLRVGVGIGITGVLYIVFLFLLESITMDDLSVISINKR